MSYVLEDDFFDKRRTGHQEIGKDEVSVELESGFRGQLLSSISPRQD